MKKQDKSYLIFGLLAIVMISLWLSSREIKEGFKHENKGSKPANKYTPANLPTPGSKS
jgi:hypothetical protein